MSEIAQRYARLAHAFRDKVAAVPDDRWSSPSPCEGWTARDVVRHVVDTHGMFLGFAGRELGDIPSTDDDPLAAFEAASHAVQTTLNDPEAAKTEYDGFAGRSTFEAGIDGFIAFDLVVHGWDLSRATGLDEQIDPSDIERVMQRAHEFGDAMRSPGAFGPAVEPPPDADEQAKLLAFLGRQP